MIRLNEFLSEISFLKVRRDCYKNIIFSGFGRRRDGRRRPARRERGKRRTRRFRKTLGIK